MARGMNVGSWTGVVVGAIVLLIVVSALLPTLTDSLTSYDENDTSGIGTVLVTIVPVLLGVGILLVFVYGFLPAGKKGR